MLINPSSLRKNDKSRGAEKREPGPCRLCGGAGAQVPAGLKSPWLAAWKPGTRSSGPRGGGGDEREGQKFHMQRPVGPFQEQLADFSPKVGHTLVTWLLLNLGENQEAENEIVSSTASRKKQNQKEEKERGAWVAQLRLRG